MDFRHSEEQLAFYKSVKDFAARVVEPGAQLVLYRAAWMKQEGLPHQVEASVAKYFVAEAAMRNAVEATQIFGGYGYIKEYPVKRSMRDAKLISIGGGTSEMQKMIIARELLGDVDE